MLSTNKQFIRYALGEVAYGESVKEYMTNFLSLLDTYPDSVSRWAFISEVIQDTEKYLESKKDNTTS